jgi:putative transposase
MSRPLRLEFEGALYHVTSRGDRREPIYDDDIDRDAFLDIVGDAMERFDAIGFAYCLMGNHYHLVIQTRQANLSRLMRHVNGVYTQTYNRRHRLTGHLFQGRFKAVVVDGDAYFLEVCRYVDLNPVRAGMVRRPQDWRWSSFRAHVGDDATEPPAWLDSSSLHRQLAPRSSRRDGPLLYAKFVAQGHGVRLWDEALSGQIFLGGDAFVQRMQALAGKSEEKEIPRAQRRPATRPLQWYFDRNERDVAISLAYFEGGYRQTAIAQITGLSVSRVSRLIGTRRS